MPDHPTALLRHLGHGPPHYDWLLATDDVGPLFCFRADRPATDWLAAGRLELTALPPHRRLYLDYEGPISDGRGTVTRIDRGTHRPEVWTDDRIVTAIAWQSENLRMELARETGDLWIAHTGI